MLCTVYTKLKCTVYTKLKILVRLVVSELCY